jgi:hypothetical protein
MSSPISNTGRNTADSLQRRIKRLQELMADQQDRLSRGSQRLGALGLLIIGAIAVYMFWGMGVIAGVLEPKTLVATLEELLMSNLGAARQTLEQEIHHAAPQWAEDLSKEAIQSLPTARARIEQYVMDQFETAISEVRGMTAEQFRDIIRQNRRTFEEAFTALAGGPDQSERFLAELQPLLEAQLGRNMKDESEELLVTLRHLNTKLERLHEGKGLNGEEALERETIMICRRLSLQQAAASE